MKRSQYFKEILKLTRFLSTDFNMKEKQQVDQIFSQFQATSAPQNYYLQFFQQFCYAYHMQFQLFNKNNEVKQEEIENLKEEYIEEKQEYTSESEKKQNSLSNKTIKKKYYIYPGETKNYYKNIGQKLCQFIKQNFDDMVVQNDQNIQSFLKIKNQKYNRNHFESFLQSKIARQISKQFFGNYQWCSQFLEINKSEIDLYFRHNPKILKRKNTK